MVKIVVPESNFLVHEELLCRASQKFERQLRGSFKEASSGVISDCEEPPHYMGVFLAYIYFGESALIQDIGPSSRAVDLARMYCMAERLDAKSFQESVMSAFAASLDFRCTLPAEDICTLLHLVYTELPEREKDHEYPLRSLVLWCAVSSLFLLKNHPRFETEILDKFPGLAKTLLLRAKDSEERNPFLSYF
ncbi:hypothetical protein IWX90DRAFT_411673 [Phyllosticta citrichinensis]|uniref:BTB domain-containing protein n=1 Tax=Phyllosticta citrichinensis TaxID=1130410 RepID=A0ABR1Y255_9PEZI